MIESFEHILNDHLVFPAFIVNADGKIVSFNQSAKDQFNAIGRGKRIFEIFNEQSDFVERLFIEARTFKRLIKEKSVFTLNGSKIESEIVISVYDIDDDYRFIFSIHPLLRNSREVGGARFSVITTGIDELLLDSSIKHIIELIKASYPFTFIGKSNLLREINNLTEFFWIKDTSGKYIVVNNVFANSLNLKAAQIEGKEESEFVPKHKSVFYKSLSEFIRETSITVVHEGLINFGNFKNSEGKEIIEFPIIDIDDNVVAIIGLTHSKSKESKVVNLNNSYVKEVVNSNTSPYILINKKFEAIIGNRGFKELFSLNPEVDIENIKVNEFLPNEIFEQLKKLADGKNVNLEFKYISQAGLLINKNTPILVKINKIFNKNNEIAGYGILFQKEETEKLKTANKVKMYETLLQASPEPMFIYDVENLKFLEVNAAAIRLYGYSRESFLQMDLTDLYAPEDIQSLLQSSKSASAEGEFTGPWRQKKKDGTSIFVEISKTTFQLNNRKTHVNIIRNVSEKLKSYKQLQLFKASFELSSDPILITDRDGFIKDANSTAVEIFGYPIEELTERSFLSLLGDEDRAAVNTGVFKSNKKEKNNFNVQLKKSDKELVNAELISSPVENFANEIDSFNIFLKLEKKEVETIIKIEEREVAVKEPSAGIDPEFLSNVFHEILTPINVIIGFTQELHESIENPNEEQVEAHDIITENQKMLLSIMDSVVEYTSIEQKKIKVKTEEIVFVDLLDSITASVKKAADNKKVEIMFGKISSSLKIESDKNRLQSLIGLLLKVAVQITKESKIYLSSYPVDDENCIISVKDNRNSISLYLATSLNDIFTQDENTIRKNFGLSRITMRLAKKLKDLLNAEAKVIEKEGVATEYGFLIPIKYSTIENDEYEISIAPEPSKLQINTLVEENIQTIAVAEVSNKNEIINQPTLNIVQQGSPQLPQYPVHEPGFYAQPTESKQPIINVNVQSATEVKSEISQHNQMEGNFYPPQYYQPQNGIPANIPPVQPQISIPEQPKMSFEQEVAKPEKHHADFSQYSCLYFEDQIDSQILFKVQMKGLKSIDFAVSFETALPLLQSKKYDFIVMDMNLQGEYNGLDSLRMIQRMPGYEFIPVIAATAYVMPGDDENFINAGFSDFISKPILRDRLQKTLEKIFNK